MRADAPDTALRPLVAFHWQAGTRAALRATVILGCAVVFALGSAPEPLSTLRESVRGVVGAGWPPVATESRRSKAAEHVVWHC